MTVLEELGPKLDAEKLGFLARAFERTVVQRLGYLLGCAGLIDHANKLHEFEAAGTQWIELDPSLAADPETASPAIERDKRWRVIVRRVPERDI